MRDLLATAAVVDSGESFTKVLQSVSKPTLDGFQTWQLAAVAGTLDALDRLGKGGEKLSPEVRETVGLVVAHARRLCDKDEASETDLLQAMPLLARDRANRADDLKRLAGLLAASRPAAVQSAAIAALARIPDKAVPASLISVWERIANTSNEST